MCPRIKISQLTIFCGLAWAGGPLLALGAPGLAGGGPPPGIRMPPIAAIIAGIGTPIGIPPIGGRAPNQPAIFCLYWGCWRDLSGIGGHVSNVMWFT